jgi:hypothetical protein
MRILTAGMTLLAAMGLGVPAARADERAGRELLERLVRDRSTIRSGQVEYTIRVLKSRDEPASEGSTRRCRIWFDGENRRYDMDEDRPAEPTEARKSRWSREDGHYRIIDVDRGDWCVREYTRDYLKGAEAPGLIVAPWDPRLLGCLGVEPGLLRHHTLEDVVPADPRATIDVWTDVVTGLTRVDVTRPSGAVWSWFFAADSLLPLRIVTRLPETNAQGARLPNTRIEVEIHVGRVPNGDGKALEFPRTIHARRIVEDQVHEEETVEVTAAKFNVPIEPSIWSWKGLAPTRGAPYIHNDVYKADGKKRIGWDGSQFAVRPLADWSGRGGAPHAPVGSDHTSLLRSISVVLAAVASISTVAWLVMKRRPTRLHDR